MNATIRIFLLVFKSKAMRKTVKFDLAPSFVGVERGKEFP
jgi:hypothetical protein